jgi:hypothetical protein
MVFLLPRTLFPSSPADNFNSYPGIVGVLASKIRLDGPASLRNSSNGEDEKLNVESPLRSLVTCDCGVNNVLDLCLGVSSVVFGLLRGNCRAWVGNRYLDLHLSTGWRTSTPSRPGPPATFWECELDSEHAVCMFTADSNGFLSTTSRLPLGV